MDFPPPLPGWTWLTGIITVLLALLRRGSVRRWVTGCWDATLDMLAFFASLRQGTILKSMWEYENHQRTHWERQAMEAQAEITRLAQQITSLRESLDRCRDACDGG